MIAVTGDSSPLTRRQLIKAGAGVAVLGGAGLGVSELLRGAGERTLRASAAATRGAVLNFNSRPDLKPPALEVTGATNAPGYVLIDPSWGNGSQVGPLIVDNRGEPVWFNPIPQQDLATNFRVQAYQGRDVLTWWQGREVQYYGQGEGVIADHSYREVGRVQAGGGRQVDLHEFVLTPEGTALFTCFPRFVTADLSSIGGPRQTTLVDSIFQEVDVRTGRLLLEWRGLDHIAPEESYEPFGEPWDYLHVNSINVTDDGNLLVSGRGTWSVYKLDRRTGAVIWRLGGKHSDFTMARGAQFFYQHDAAPVTSGTISLFDNGSDGTHSPGDRSRALVLDLDERSASVQLSQVYTRAGDVLSGAMGSVQVGSERVLVGWGNDPYVSEYAADGNLLWDAKLLAGGHSYRAFRSPWRGQPDDLPAISVTGSRLTGERTVYVSWNGATEVGHWQVLSGARPDRLSPVGIARRRGFETAIPLGMAGGYVAVRALDDAGAALGTSAPVKL